MTTPSSFGNSKYSKQALDIAAFELLTDLLEKEHTHKVSPPPNTSIMFRQDLRAMYDLIGKQKPDWVLYKTSTSGSTGEPLSVHKSYLDYIWYQVSNVREILWNKLDVSLNQAIIKPFENDAYVKEGWGLPRGLKPVQGKTFINGYKPISELQRWLEEVNPHYIYAAPTIIGQLDLSRLSNFRSWRGTGEKGGTNYSSEECGTIALRCPDNPSNYHVMENQIVEVDTDGCILISTMSSPYIRRYRHGDMVTLGQCTCGRTLQTISDIKGRIRNMFVLPNGDKKWPLFGSRTYHEKFGIKRFKMIQTAVDRVTLQVITDNILDRDAVEAEARRLLQFPVHVEIEYVQAFPDYKFEEFVSML